VDFNRGWPDRIEPAEWNAFTQKYKGSKIDFYYPSKEDIVQSLELLAIKYNGYDSYISLCIHKITHEAYITETENTFQGDIQRGGCVNSKIISVSKASLEAATSIVEKEYNSSTVAFSQAKRNNWKTPFVINGNSYRIEWFVVVDDVEISMNEIFSNEKVFEVPAQCLTKEQHAKYAEYYHRPGPYEHYFTLPAECCQKLIRKLIPLEF
jgi:hypothetical protein